MAVAVHLAYALFVPRSEMSTIMAAFASENGANTFAVSPETVANNFLKHSSADVVVATCLFDLSTGPVKVSSSIVGNYWSLSVYSSIGDVIYTLNDRQAASDEVMVSIHRKGDVVEETPGSGNELHGSEAAIASDHWQGFIVIRAGISLPNQYEFVASKLAESTCRA